MARRTRWEYRSANWAVEALMQISTASAVTSFVMFLVLLSTLAHAGDPTFYWVCKMQVTIPDSAPHTLYVSDINGPLPNRIPAGYTSDRMSGAFHAFVAEQYKVDGGASCTGFDTKPQAEDAAKKAPPNSGPLVPTGWKYAPP